MECLLEYFDLEDLPDMEDAWNAWQSAGGHGTGPTLHGVRFNAYPYLYAMAFLRGVQAARQVHETKMRDLDLLVQCRLATNVRAEA